MSQPFDPKRRAISAAAALALLGFPVITIGGCGGGGGGNPAAPPTPAPNPTSTPTPSAGDAQGSVSANHGHTAVVTGAQLQAGNALTLDIRGSSNHNHTLALSAADVTAIRGGQRISRSSSVDDAHDHSVTFN